MKAEWLNFANEMTYALAKLETNEQLWLLGYLLGLTKGDVAMPAYKLGFDAGLACRTATDGLESVAKNPFVGIFREDKGSYEEDKDAFEYLDEDDGEPCGNNDWDEDEDEDERTNN